jgi:hypothetical protein
LPNHEIKSAAITFGGYLYQNLIGLEVLYGWLEDPRRYEWVQFEADEDELAKAKGLDDIVALRADGTYSLLQVKFTVDPQDDANALGWNWLLDHKPKGRSLLQKWAGALFSIGTGKVFEAALMTNRIPDREFLSHLDPGTNYIDITRIPEKTKQLIETQLGGKDQVVRFFDAFEFRHSHQGYAALQSTLLDRFVPRHATRHGWLELSSEAVMSWSVRRNYPPPNGRITLHHIRKVLSSQRPEPLDESFRVPASYQLPDEGFGHDFLDLLESCKQQIIVLWGSPGQGKSTFLSFICGALNRTELPFIRHHYFLDLGDTSDRFSYWTVSNSLMAQMETQHIEYVHGQGSGPEQLRAWIEACATGYGRDGKPFVVIVDGLDHVWRENEKNKEPLDTLFRELLPVPENVCLVIGTQRVAEQQLPALFHRFVNDKNWIELPRMSLSAVKHWLKDQLAASRFKLPEFRASDEEIVTQLADSFHRLSDGHPLHLTYSFEALSREHSVLLPHMVDEMPDCPDGDIREYYRLLWQRLSYSAKDALHLVAETGFVWPVQGLEDCLDLGAADLNPEIGHLFYVTEVGRMPFHGSILAYVREHAEHSARVVDLIPRIVSWLEQHAPDFHRWGWLWIYRARIGQYNELLLAPNREWVVESLVKAYPVYQMVEILRRAEQLAFNKGLYPRAVRLRFLKTRLANGTNFQIDDFNRFHACALTLTPDDYSRKLLGASTSTASIDELHLLGKQYLLSGRVPEAKECVDEMRKRLNDRLHAGALNRPSLEKAYRQFLELVAGTKHFRPSMLVENIQKFPDLCPDLFRFFLRELSKHHDIGLLVDLLSCPMTTVMRQDLEVAIVRLAGACKARLHEWAEFASLSNHPIVNCWAGLYAKDKTKSISPDFDISKMDYKGYDDSWKSESERLLHCLFFQILSDRLNLGKETPGNEPPVFKERGWLNVAINALRTAALSAGSHFSRGEVPGYSFCFRIIESVNHPTEHSEFSDYDVFRKAILSISVDLFLLGALRADRTVTPDDWRAVNYSKHFVFSYWLDHYMGDGFRIATDESVRSELDDQLTKTSRHLNEYGRKLYEYLELCELAIYQGLHETAILALKKTGGCVMGYGSHKDMTVYRVLEAIGAIRIVSPDRAREALERVFPIVFYIDTITDGDDTREAKFKMADLMIDLMPRTYAAYYDYLLQVSEWYEAEMVFSKLLARESLDNPLMSFVASAVWEEHGISALRGRVHETGSAAQSFIDANAKIFGHASGEIGKSRFEETKTPDEEIDLSVEDYPPESFGKLLDDLQSRHAYMAERKIVRRWFCYWTEQGRGADVLRALSSETERDYVPSAVSSLLDDAYTLSLGLEGKHKAYRWLVTAQIHCHGWDDFYSWEDATRRFACVAEHYKDRWQDFLRDTSRSIYRKERDELVIPNDRLVHYLIAVGQKDMAIEVTEEVVSAILEDVSEQRLALPAWFTGE